MKSDVCSKCGWYEGGDCYDSGRSTPIQNVCQCGIADEIMEALDKAGIKKDRDKEWDE